MRAAAVLVIALATAGCEKDLLAELPDAPLPDAPPPDAVVHCPAVQKPYARGTYKLYLNTEGVALTKGSDDDARIDQAVVLAADATIPAFLPGDATRQAYIDLIVGLVQDALGPYSIDVVTTRPASGDYEMTVMGGTPALIGAVTGAASVAPGVCDAMNRDRVSVVFDGGRNGVTTRAYAYSILSDFGALVGLSVTSDVLDCMCRVNGCGNQPDLLCTYGTMATTSPVHDCGRVPTQDEPALLTTILGCR